jgi:hypothetical protein
MRNRSLILAVLALATITFGDAAASNEVDDHRAKIIARRESLSNVTVRYRRGDRFYPRGDLPKIREVPGGKIVQKTEPEGYLAEFRFDRGRAMYSKERTDAVPEGDFMRMVVAVSEKRLETLIEDAELMGHIQSKRELPALEYIDITLGLRAFGGDEWPAAEKLRKAELDVHDDGRVSLRWVDGPRGEYEYYFDPKRGYALVHFTRGLRGVIASTIHNADFRKVDELYLPQQSVYTEYRHAEGQATPSYIVTMDVDEYKLGDVRNQQDDFRIEWPLKSYVLHSDLKISVRVMSRPQKLDDDVFRRAAKAR